jgi:hypothetical protein
MNGPIDGFNPTRFGRMLYSRQEFATFAQKFTLEGDTRIEQPATGRRFVARDFEVDDGMVQDFRKQLADEGLRIDETAFAADLPFIRAELRYEIDLALFGVAEARRHMLQVDPQARLALTHFDDARRLLSLSASATKVAQ